TSGDKGRMMPRGQKNFKVLSKVKLLDAVDKIGFVKLASAEGRDGSVAFDGGNTGVKFGDELKTAELRAGYLPIWWLPWVGLGAMTKIKISMVTLNGLISLFDKNIADLPNPPVCFTTRLSGCSIFVKGDPREPSFYHGGSEDSPTGTIGKEQ